MSATTALLVIDVQVNMFDPANPCAGGDALLARVGDLVARARAAGAPIVYVRNCGGPGDPDQEGTPGWQLHPSLRPAAGEPVLDKRTCDTFASTMLASELSGRGVDAVVIAGLQSEFCVRETALGALARGLAVTLVSDAHSTFGGGDRTAAALSAEVEAELSERAAITPSAAVTFA